MPKYRKRLLKSTDLGKFKQSTIMISREDKKWMDAEELKSYYNSLMKDAKKDNTQLGVMIKVLAGTRWFTLKEKSGELKIKSVEEYFEGRVKDEEKFANFSQIHVTVWKPKKIEAVQNVKQTEKEGVKHKDDKREKIKKDDKKRKDNTDDEDEEDDEVVHKKREEKKE
jgi:hypothetical protein